MNLNNIRQIGIVGGGVSSLMLCIEAAKLGIQTTLLDPKIDCIGAQIATEHIIATINNENIQKLSLRTDIVIFNTALDFEICTKLHAKTYPSKEVMNEISNPKNVLELLEELEIPTAKAYYQDNKSGVCDQISELTLPFKFIKQYSSYSQAFEIRNREDLEDFIAEVDDKADGFILQTMPQYERTIVCLAVVNESGKIYLYDPLEKVYNEEKVCSLKVADDLTKTMVQKLARFNRKILKEIKAEGIFTIKYGIKANKSVEVIEITPELDVASILTLEAHDVSIYEQYMHLLVGMNVVQPVLENLAHGTIKDKSDEAIKGKHYHLYNLGLTNLCITKERK